MEEGTIIAAQILDGYYFYRVPVNADGCTLLLLMGIGRCMADVLSAGLNANECREAYLRGINTRG